MRLCIMKQNCLNTIKSNLETFYPQYFSEKDNSWMEKVCGENPFVVFGKEIPDFSLAAISKDNKIADIDLENCKIVYTNLKFLSESQASDERLWAGLTNGVFYDYMRKRCGYDINDPKPKEKQVGEIRSRFFFKGGRRAGFYRNFLAKYWWVGRALYDGGNTNHFEKLDIIGSRDISTKISDIFYSNTYSSNPEILDGIVLFFQHLNNIGFKYKTMGHIRPCLKHLNTVGGAIVLDCLSKEEIKEELIDYLDHLLSGDETEAHSSEYEDDDELEDDDLENETDSENENQTLDKETKSEGIKLGDLVTVKNTLDGYVKKYPITIQEGGKLHPVYQSLLDKHLGDYVEIEGINYEIIEITFKH